MNINVITVHIKTRTTYHHGNLREALIDAGTALLARRGIDSITLRAVVAKAGVSPAAAYRHFSSVIDLLAAIAEQGFTQLHAAMVASLSDPTLADLSPLERIGQGYVRFAHTHPHHLRLIFSARIPSAQRPPTLKAAGRAAFDLLVDAIEQSRALGHVDASTPTPLLATAAWTFIHGLTLLLLDEHLTPEELGFSDSATMTRACQSIFRRGWGTDMAKAPPGPRLPPNRKPNS